jgi:hypothetical protein
MIRLAPQLLIAAASSLVGLGEHPSEHAEGGLIHRLLAGATDGSWDAALVHHLGYRSHYDHRSDWSAWPVAAPRAAEDLGAFGARTGVLRESPEEGDIFLQFSPLRRIFVHAGIVVQVCTRAKINEMTPYFEVVTIEGDTDGHGRLRGGRTMRITRRLSPSSGDRFLRWVDLDQQFGALRLADESDVGVRHAGVVAL